MGSKQFDESFWSGFYQADFKPWDIGFAAPSITTYFDQIEDKSICILIPGCGLAYEAEYLFDHGFQNVWIADISHRPLEGFIKRVAGFPRTQLLHSDFFTIEGPYDIIMEQTFFCSLDPSLRANYVQKCHDLLSPGGKIVGLLFNREFDRPGPPFGGKRDEYIGLFSNHFTIKIMEPCYNSIPPRMGHELFIILEKKED